MRSHAPDPYARIRALWPMLRLFARWVIWRHRALAASGLLKGRASRWLAGRLGMVEHGLRCLLVIGAQRYRQPPSPSSQPSGEAAQMRGPPPPNSANVEKRVPVSPAAPPNRDDKEMSSPLGGADLAPRAFSLSLAAFNLPPAGLVPDAQRPRTQLPAAQRARPADGSSDGRSPIEVDAPSHSAHPGESRDLRTQTRVVSEDPGLRRDERVNARADEQAGLASRLAAIFDVFENTEHHIARMARHLARRNIKLRRRATTRPSGAGRARWVDALTQALRSFALGPQSPARTVAQPDTS